MKRLLTICIMLTAIALIAAPAFAEVQNVKVSGDVNSGGVSRDGYNLLSSDTAGRDATPNNFLYTQARVRVDADLTDNVMTTIRLLTEFDWDTAQNTSGTGDNVDLDLASVTLKEVFYQPLTVTVGRQELRYGNAFVIGDPDTNATSADGDAATDFTARDLSLRKSFDAIKAVFDYDPLVIDVFTAKISETNTTKTDVNLYGVNAAYDVGIYDSEVEAYWFISEDDTAGARVAGTRAGRWINTIGARGSLTPIDNLNLLGEIAIQRGEYSNDVIGVTDRDQKAMAYQVAGEYAFPDVTIPYINTTIMNPMVKVGYTHYSGEEAGNAGDHEAWIPLYEDQTHGVVANTVLSGVNGGQNSNADILNVGGSISPIQDLTVSLDLYKFWLDEKLVAANCNLASDPMNNGSGTALEWTNLTETNYYMYADDDLGFEVDLALNYDYTEDVKMGLSAGYFSPGDAFAGANGAQENAETAVQVLATLDVAF